MLSEETLQPVVKLTQKVLTDMCAVGLRTPVSLRPMRKRTAILTTCQRLADSLEPFKCAGSHAHQQIAGQLSLQDGRQMSVSHYASSYCRGFAMHVCQCLLEDRACAAEGSKVPFRRRVRFKGPNGFPKGRSHEGSAQKRSPEEEAEGSARSLPQPRVLPANTVPSAGALASAVWQPIFAEVKNWAPTRGSMLIPEAEEAMIQIQSRLPEVEVLQAFVGINNRTLCSPVGALPATTAPYGITLVQRRGPKFWCLGTDDRTRMRTERKYAPITQCEILLTVFAGPKGGPVNRPAAGEFPPPEPTVQPHDAPPVRETPSASDTDPWSVFSSAVTRRANHSY